MVIKKSKASSGKRHQTVANSNTETASQAVIGTARKDSPSLGIGKVTIAELAYIRWQERGYTHGDDLGDWLAAEREFQARYGND